MSKLQPGKPPIIIVAAPSGAGKSSFVERVTREVPGLCDTVTYTTRAARAGETEGHPYHFVDRARFAELRDSGFFVEWAVVHENQYGTPMHQLSDAWARGETVIMDVDVQGAKTFKAKFPLAVAIFILPPSIEELRRRVTKRDGRVPADLELRMANAQREIAQAADFDIRLVNDDFAKSYGQFKKIIEDLLQRA
jgi:guanylate kinase